MTERYQSHFLDNAIDSLNEALLKYGPGHSGDAMSSKFCVRHLSHFLELVLKHYAWLAHPLLIYKHPFSENLDDESPTIDLQDAIHFFRNDAGNPSDQLLQDLVWLKKLRCRIDQHRLDIDQGELECTIGRLVRAFLEFDQDHANLQIDELIDADRYPLFLELADNYDLNLKRAENVIEAAWRRSHDDPDFRTCRCSVCDHDTVITNQDSPSGYRCAFCGTDEAQDTEHMNEC